MAPIPDDYASQLKFQLFTGNLPTSLKPGVAGVQMVDLIFMKEKFKNSTVEAKKEDYVTHHKLAQEKFSEENEILENVLLDGHEAEVLSLLVESIKEEGVCWQTVVQFYVWMIKRSGAKNTSISLAYQHFNSIVKDSNMLFFFLKLLQVAQPNGKRPGFGRGLKKAIISWYQSLSPTQLILEFWYRPSGYGWSHKDILKLIHWNISKPNVDVGYKVATQFILNKSLEKLATGFTSEDAEKYVSALNSLYGKADKLPENKLKTITDLEENKKYRLLKHRDPILSSFQELTELLSALDDKSVLALAQDPYFIRKVAPPFAKPREEDDLTEEQDEQIEEYTEVCEVLLEKLEGEGVLNASTPMDNLVALNSFIKFTKGSVMGIKSDNAWISGRVFLSTKRSLPRMKGPAIKTFMPEYMIDIKDQIDRNCRLSAKKTSIGAEHKDLVVIAHLTENLRQYVNGSIGLNIHRRFRGIQAIIVALYNLSYIDDETEPDDGLGNRVMLIHKNTGLTGFTPIPNHDIFEHCLHALKLHSEACSKAAGRLKEALRVCYGQGKRKMVFMAEALTVDLIKEAMAHVNSTTDQDGFIKLAIIGIRPDLLTDFKDAALKYNPRLMVLNGFNFRTLSVVRGFLQTKL